MIIKPNSTMQATQETTVADCLSTAIEKICESSASIPIIGLSGPQGAGKTTALNALYKQSKKRIATLGIDDFYLTKSERIDLANEVSPLYKTRGPAGTHDIKLIEKTLASLLSAKINTRTPLISFDKVSDDRRAESDWCVFEGKPDVIILEGWLVGAVAPSDFSDSDPINDIELSDQGSAWRRYQQQLLDRSYSKLWDSFDAFIHIKGPGFEAVFDWRKQQEASNLKIDEDHLSNERIKWLNDFIQHYQRLTVAMGNNSHRSGATISIDKNRMVTGFDLADF